jgi:hypothetical protein
MDEGTVDPHDIHLVDLDDFLAGTCIEYDMLAASRTVQDVFCNGEWVRAEPVDLPWAIVRQDRQMLPPIPERLFCALGPLPGKAMGVYLMLWHRSRLVRRATLTCTRIIRLGITRQQQTRALACLAQHGFVIVQHRRKKPPRVTLRPEEAPWLR